MWQFIPDFPDEFPNPSRASLYDRQQAGWRDLRDGKYSAAWCHGAVGIGLAAADLLASSSDPRYRDVLARASTASLVAGMGWNHALCHGHFGCWEVLNASIQHGVAPAGLDRSALDAQLLSSLERHGPVSDVSGEEFQPALLPGGRRHRLPTPANAPRQRPAIGAHPGRAGSLRLASTLE